MSVSTRNDRLAAITQNDPRWAAVLARDPKAEFYYAVKTTGVYCRPSCSARLARPENVRFFLNCEDAEKAGFRPCKRCKPNQVSLAHRYAAKISSICRLLEDEEATPSLQSLAEAAGMSAWHFHRVFKAVTGLTPKAYASAHRANLIRKSLNGGGTVTDAIYEAGYNSSSRFYEVSNEMLGMTPSAYRAGGARTDIRFAVGECSLGSILVAQSDRGICAILLGTDPDSLVRQLEDQFPKANLIGADAEFEGLVARVVGFVEQPSLGLELPLDVRGTAFQQRVWQALRAIPAGTTVSYTDVARRIGAPTAARAVAQACGANTLAVAIPCHRVVRSDGALSGYRWGVERKRALLEREARQ